MDREGVEQQPNMKTLIRDYGEFWDPEWVNWNNSQELFGQATKSKKSKPQNFFNRQGIYVLYKDYVPVYVGEAVVGSIGKRLQGHRASRRKGPRWDTFSWFSLDTADLAMGGNQVIHTIEALLITVIDPRLNSRKEKIRGAQRWYQSEPERADPEPKLIADRLQSVEKKLDRLLSRRK